MLIGQSCCHVLLSRAMGCRRVLTPGSGHNTAVAVRCDPWPWGQRRLEKSGAMSRDVYSC